MGEKLALVPYNQEFLGVLCYVVCTCSYTTSVGVMDSNEEGVKRINVHACRLA